MKPWKIVAGICLALATQFLAVQSERGTFHRTKDEDFQMLIAGGMIPDKGKYVRNLVSIRTVQFIEFHGDNHFCTGVIISSRTVMTAAHCVTDRHKSVMSSRELLIVFGSVYRLDHYNDDDSRRVDVVVVHPNYSRFNSYDVALLRMVSRIPGNMRHVKPIIKRKKINIKRGMKCTTLGWGQLYLHGPYANELIYLDVYIADSENCLVFPMFIKGIDICTITPEAARICPGDLGGPLMCQDQLAGIIGGTYGCSGRYGLKFINFTHIEKWVHKMVISMSSASRISMSSASLSVTLYVVCQLHYH